VVMTTREHLRLCLLLSLESLRMMKSGCKRYRNCRRPRMQIRITNIDDDGDDDGGDDDDDVMILMIKNYDDR
jgi:hypothetical protein